MHVFRKHAPSPDQTALHPSNRLCSPVAAPPPRRSTGADPALLHVVVLTNGAIDNAGVQRALRELKNTQWAGATVWPYGITESAPAGVLEKLQVGGGKVGRATREGNEAAVLAGAISDSARVCSSTTTAAPLQDTTTALATTTTAPLPQGPGVINLLFGHNAAVEPVLNLYCFAGQPVGLDHLVPPSKTQVGVPASFALSFVVLVSKGAKG